MTTQEQRVKYEFGEFTLLPNERQLSRDGNAIPLTPKAFQTLLALVKSDKKLVTKDELMEAVWGDVIVEETGLVRNISVLRKVLDDNDLKNPKFIETVSGYGYRFLAEIKTNSTDKDTNLSKTYSLAILPFQTVGLDEKDKYLGIGFADSLITRLSNIKRLVVRPTGSILKFANQEREPFEAGAELDVQFVLDGVIMQLGEQVRITVQGIDLNEQKTAFGEKFEANLEELPHLQDMISEQIIQQLLLNVTPEEKEQLTPKHLPNPQAYQSYLKGRYFFSRRTPQNLWEAFEHFVTATNHDQEMALAYVGLANVYAHLQLRMALPSTSEHLTKARSWLTKAVELDPNIAEAHATLGYFAYFYEWDWEKAAKEFLKALEISPNDVDALQYYANFLSRQGRFKEAREQIQRALELDSSSFQSLFLKVQIHYREQNFELAWKITEDLIETYSEVPKLYHVFLLLGTSYSIRGKHDEAFEILRKAETFSLRSFDGAKELIGTFGAAHARANQIEETEKCLEKLKILGMENDVDYEFSAIYANLGDFDKAFEYLDKLVERKDWRLVHLKAELDFLALHDDERFKKLLNIIGL